MKKYMTTSKTLILLLTALILTFTTSCNKKEEGEQPELPPVESLVMDFSDFDSRPDQTKGVAISYNNFVYSYLNIVFWNTISTGTIALPTAAYLYMLEQDPEYLGDNKWEWTYEFTFNQADYIATLTGIRLNNEEFSMEMEIAYSGFTGAAVKWFDGVIRYDHTAATWNLYKYDDLSTVKIIEVEWTKDYEAETSSLSYTYVEPGKEQTGSSITLGKDPSLDYDAWYTISLASETIDIQWDTETKAGRVKNPDHFQDSNWHCWNSDLMDIECPDL